MIKIKVPATTANLGPGFDSCGLALSLYLTLSAIPAARWSVDHQLGASIPTDESNLIIQTALRFAPMMPPHHLVMTCDIPSTRGLGSSAAAIVAGIELADSWGKHHWSRAEKMRLATLLEGHPDNVAPAVFGGLVVAVQLGDQTHYTQHAFPDCDLIAFIPSTELATSLSRGVLPTTLSYQTAVKASAISNVMVASLLSGNLAQVGQMMAADLLHEHYRQTLVPDLTNIRTLVSPLDAYGCCLSGAGPTVLVLSPPSQSHVIMTTLQQYNAHATVTRLQVDVHGVQSDSSSSN